ncbi:OVARIAN TUMOR DOMAIN-containing deubiquitinating enzyme 1-like isoform X2 [Coffea arabica]|uniref:OVARIAN TUMOR DOMAIN-containing deubiquitinating enzyme 1-like isoform X2 n=1 Tax=Coffea arabica TaxID=13443 RepID=A0ABM4W3R6_COFAR
MQNLKAHDGDAETEKVSSTQASDIDDWANFKDDDIMQQQFAIQAEEAEKIPFVGDKEPLSSLANEYKSGSSILLEKIKEHVMESQDQGEIDRIKANVEQCRMTLRNLGYAEFTFEDFFALFLEQLDCVIQGSETSISLDELVQRSRDQSISDYVVMFFRFVTSGEIRKRSEFFEPFILGLTSASVEQFCKSAVEPMGEESDHVHITALSDALGVPIRVVYLDRSSCDNGSVSVNHHDFHPVGNDLPSAKKGGAEAIDPFITLLYRPGHYDILYPK